MNDNIIQNFLNPEKKYSPMPFWFWNDSFKEEEIIRQIHEMNDKGVNGFVIHPRIGIPREIPYMSDSFLGYVRCAVEEAHKLGMSVILYDEGMYPSGSAHGLVVKKDPKFGTRGIRMEESSGYELDLSLGERTVCTLAAKKTAEGVIEQGSIQKHDGGYIPEGYVFLHLIEGFTYGHIRGIHIGEDDWEEPPRSADILNPESVAAFIELTHEKYYEVLSEYFGNTIIGIFVDEPCTMGREGDPRMKPWTWGFEEVLRDEGIELTELPALWYSIGDDTAAIRQKYASAVEKRLKESFYKQIYDWCTDHGIALVGHPGDSMDIGLLDYFHIPGQDLIFRRVAPEDEKALLGADSTQAKCSSDAARYNGCRRNLNECFACGGKNGVEWAFSADDMKWTMDWLFVRGVNMLIPHAFFYSLEGERRYGERPPDVGHNNIWWKHYGTISDYIKRMSYMMTDCVNVTPIAVICKSDFLPYEVAKPLYENQIEFNYLDVNLLESDKCRINGGEIRVASQCYTTLVVEDSSLLSAGVTKFASRGGRVIVLNPENKPLNDGIVSVTDTQDMLKLIERDLIITPGCDNLRVSHIVKEDEHFYVLTNEGESDIIGTVSIFADDEIMVLDPWNGTISPYEGQKLALNRRESIILRAGQPKGRKEILFGTDADTCRKTVELNEWYADSKRITLGSWMQNSRLKDFCGTLVYDTEFDISISDVSKVILDMGAVGEQAEVYLNGEYLGFKLWAPYTMDLTKNLSNGKNKLSVAVTNSLANKYTDKLQPSGLLSKVVLKIF